jgi:multiple sugar transport system substrate-binding protein
MLALVSVLASLSMVISACDMGGGAATPTAVTQPTSTTQSAVATQTTATSSESPTAASAKPTGSIDLQAFGDPPEIKVIEAVIEGFKEQYPGTQVNLISIPSQGDHMTKLQTAFAAGNPPDVWVLNYRRYGQFAAKGVVEPVGPLLEKSSVIKEDMYFEPPIEAFNFDGTLQCLPQNISSLVVYYNKDLFTKNNVPFPKDGWTWQDFLDTAKALTKDIDGDGKMDTHGLGVDPQIIRVAPFVWQNGGEIVDNPEKPTKLTLRDGPAREALDFFLNLQLVHRVVPNEAEATAEDLEARFMNGKLGMYMASRVATPAFREITGFDWDVGPLPVGKERASILHSDAFCISKDAKNKDLAWAFVEYSQSPPGQIRAADLGRTVPSLKEVANSDVFLKPTLPPASAKVFLDAIPDMHLVPIVSTWPRIESMANEEIERAFYAMAPVEEVLTKLEEESTKLFAEANQP